MRKKIVAGNWKMNTNLQEGVALAKEINEALKAAQPKCDVHDALPIYRCSFHPSCIYKRSNRPRQAWPWC